MKPTLVYDENCDFCTRAARTIARHGAVQIVGFDDLSAELRERLPADFRSCAHFVTDENVFSCGEAVERSVAHTELAPAGLFAMFRAVPGYGTAREGVYRLVAANRSHLSRLLPR